MSKGKQPVSTPSAGVPISILTGFLGSGKTTLMNHILHDKTHGMKFAIIENEFGDVGVDDALVTMKEESKEEIIEMMNGCICCNVRGDLVPVVKKLLARKDSFDGILIETTGLADPAPVLQTFLLEPEISSAVYIDSCITVVDAKHIVQHIEEEKPEGVENEAVEQLAFADVVLLNKTDLVTAEELVDIKKKVRAIQKTAEIIETKNSVVDPKRLLGIKAFSLESVLEFEPDFLEEEGAEHMHDTSVSSISFKFEGAISVSKLEAMIGNLLRTKANDLFRYKGVLNVMGKEEKFVFQGVHMLFNGQFSDNWREGETRESKFVFIGRNLVHDELTGMFEDCKVSDVLRFKVGDKVEANIGEWTEGKILKCWDNGNPYRIRLVNGDDVWGPEDNDAYVRAL